eukprot:PhM_4_TR10516/c0_g1_i1/m.5424/K14403/CPSF3, YSH1; cleavage and polyadenylation specificity factor subunit 3
MSAHIVGGDGTGTVEVLPLGSGGEVGRSCVIVSYKGKRVMFDCGIHPALNGLNSLPIFDTVDCSSIDVVLVTHFHLDHCGALPYLCNETTFRGRVFMTHPTKAFYRMVIQDFAKVSASAHDIVTEDWLSSTMSRIETIDYHESTIVDGIRFHAYNAGHVLGAAMFFVEIAGATILYTGDYSRTPDRHLMGAETPYVSPDILIVESTYGIINHETREDRESKFLKWVTETVSRGGRCLVPVFALGRAQELLLVLEDHWETHRDLRSIPIYYISSMSKKCTQLYTTYGNMMNDRVKHRAQNPFLFKHITCLKDLRNFTDSGPCVVLASPGMLQTGVSRELFERWCGDTKNGIIIAGYCVDGTLAKEVTAKPREITREDGRVLPLRMETVESVSFSAHSDFQQTKNFLHSIPDVKHIVLVHGNREAMRKLADRLRTDFSGEDLSVHESENTKSIPIAVTPSHYGTMVGKIAAHYNPTRLAASTERSAEVRGVLVVNPDGERHIISRDELTSYADLSCCSVRCGVHIAMTAYRSISQVHAHLSHMFAECQLVPVEDGTSSIVRVAGQVEVCVKEAEAEAMTADVLQSTSTLFVSWAMGVGSDILADAVCVSLLSLVHDPATLDPVERDDIFRSRMAHQFLCQHYRDVVLRLTPGNPTIHFHDAEGTDIVVDALTLTISNGVTSGAVERLLQRMGLAMFPLALMDADGMCECPPEDHVVAGQQREAACCSTTAH